MENLESSLSVIKKHIHKGIIVNSISARISNLHEKRLKLLLDKIVINCVSSAYEEIEKSELVDKMSEKEFFDMCCTSMVEVFKHYGV